MSTYDKILWSVVTLGIGTFDENGNLLAERVDPQEKLYHPWNLGEKVHERDLDLARASREGKLR
jgi:hypothetical protein